jgi:phosphatidylglycerol:prolipoprotein diacylglycerol transferase
MTINYINWNVDPEIFKLWIFSIRWYGVLFAASFFAGYYILIRVFKKENIPVTVLDSLTIYMVVGTVIGARLGHCFFYQPAYYLAHPAEVLMVWEGGLASHGAAIGIIISILIFERVHKRSFLWTMDRVVIVVALAGLFIRLGNLMNSEIFGHVTSLPWGFRFLRAAHPLDLDPRHPTQLYEGISYLLIFVFLLWYYYKKDGRPSKGMIFGIFLTGVFGMRFLIEFVKETQEDFEKSMVLDLGQLLSIPLILAGVWLIWRAWKSDKAPA